MTDTDKYARLRSVHPESGVGETLAFYGAYDLLTDLDTANARIKELEAMCEWLAGDSPCHTGQMKCWHETDFDYERTDGCNEKSLADCITYRLSAAREAVRDE